MLDKLEIIAVNDGSTDSTLDILKAYSAKHNNLTVIDQENQGVSAARNTGIKFAKGDYIWFIDGDDYLVNGALCQVLQLLDNYKPEILVANNFRSVPHNSLFEEEKVAELDCIITRSEFTAGQVWSCVFKNNGILFPEDLKYAEDTYYSYLQYLQLPNRNDGCVKVNSQIYCYRQNPKSVMRDTSIAAIERHAKDLFLLGWKYREKIASGEIKDCDKLENTKQRQYASVLGGLTILPDTNMDADKTLTELKKYGLYPYPWLVWPYKAAKSFSGKLKEAVKMTFRFELCYKIYYKIRSLKRQN